MNAYHVIWLAGTALIVLGWFGRVHEVFAYVGFTIALVTVLVVNPLSFIDPDSGWYWLWLGGFVLIALEWFVRSPRWVSWVGLFVALCAIGMEAVQEHVNEVREAPFTLFTPLIDVAVFALMVQALTNEFFLRGAGADPRAIASSHRMARLQAMAARVRRRPDPVRFERRLEVAGDAELALLARSLRRLGRHFALNALLQIGACLALAANYYASGVSFDLGFTTANWFGAYVAFSVPLNLATYYLFEWLHGVRLFRV